MERVPTAGAPRSKRRSDEKLRSRRPCCYVCKESPMSVISKSPRVLSLIAMLTVPASVSLAAQPQDAPEADLTATVTDTSAPPPSEMTEGPKIEGFISARTGD